MAKNKVNTDPRSLSGRHIYRDDKGRVLYYKERSLTGYVIKEEYVAKYRQLSSRYIISLLGAMVGILLFEKWGIPVFLGPVLGIVCFCFMEYQFRTAFLANLVQVHNFIPKEKPKIIEAAACESKGRLLLKIVLYAAFAILLLVDIYVYLEPSNTVLISGWVVSLIAFGLALFNIYALMYQKSHPELLKEPSRKKK